MIPIDEMASFCKRKGLVYPSSELYGGLAGLYDYGPYGVEVKRNIMQTWWKLHVQDREDVVGMDGSIISHGKIWEASGHLAGFSDVLIECSKCKNRLRGDAFIEESLKISADGMSAKQIMDTIKEKKLSCPKCKGTFKDAESFNLMFPVQLGAGKDAITAYLRGETAQLIFTQFRNVSENARLKLPFGIAQMGKAFRNEISPRNFLFRMREFDQMELEYFIHPKKQDCPYLDEISNMSLQVLSAETQLKKGKHISITIKDIVKKKLMHQWHAYWFAKQLQFFTSLGCKAERFRLRQHSKDELAHYSKDCWDLEYEFPFGWKELEGIADRSDYDLKQHSEHSKQDLRVYDEETKEKFYPFVIAEPSLGVDRTFLVLVYEAYDDDKQRGNIVLHFSPKISPIKVAVFPLVKKLNEKSREVFDLLKKEFTCFHDETGSVGRRYARMDEIGTPFCVTIDFDTLNDKKVTVRDRDSTKQERIGIADLSTYLAKKLV
ncbi:MAG: glycine--tRNA ligase [Candidatus Woesearchaeota archaeon]